MADADPRTTFNVHDAKTQLSTLMDRAHAGEEIVLAKAGGLWAKLVPYVAAPTPVRKPGRFRHLLKGCAERHLVRAGIGRARL